MQPTVKDRRQHPRRTVAVGACAAASPEQRLPRAKCVDVSRGGVLLAFDEPVGLIVGLRIVVSLDLPDGHFHALGSVVRMARGEDFCSYVGIEFLGMRDEDFQELETQLDRIECERSCERRGAPGTPVNSVMSSTA